VRRPSRKPPGGRLLEVVDGHPVSPVVSFPTRSRNVESGIDPGPETARRARQGQRKPDRRLAGCDHPVPPLSVLHRRDDNNRDNNNRDNNN
jgi:hypothetical protein